MLARRPDGATDLDEAAEGAPGAAQGDDALSSSSREADGAPGPSGEGLAPAEDLSEFLAREGEDPGEYAARIFRRVFCADIESVLKMDVRPVDDCLWAWESSYDVPGRALIQPVQACSAGSMGGRLQSSSLRALQEGDMVLCNSCIARCAVMR